MNLKRICRAGIREAIRPLFGLFERLGVHVTPIHFYQPIPDTASLPDSLWTRRSELVGVDMRDEAQLTLLSELSKGYKSEFDRLPRNSVGDPNRFYLANGSFSAIDAEVYYAMLRLSRPGRLYEIGSGNSTLLAAEALRKNREDARQRAPGCEFVVIDPFPRSSVRDPSLGVTRLIESPVEQTDPAIFEALGEGDILFIDSSHVLRIGGDVVFEYLEILPRLRPGVLVHIHDIFLPAEYPKRLATKDRWFWTEQYALQAFLAFNSAFEVVFAANHMALAHPAEMMEAFASFSRDVIPGSFWIRRK